MRGFFGGGLLTIDGIWPSDVSSIVISISEIVALKRPENGEHQRDTEEEDADIQYNQRLDYYFLAFRFLAVPTSCFLVY